MRKETIKTTLGWGENPLQVTVPASALLLYPPIASEQRPLGKLLKDALNAPVGSHPLNDLLRQRQKICVLIPDATRKDVAGEILGSLWPYLDGHDVDLGVATGKHPPQETTDGPWQHDAACRSLVSLGQTRHGTQVSYPQRVLDADLRICLGEIRPHYFAGYAGGAKTIFPGVAGEEGIWHNHKLKAQPGARLGQVDGNPCRQDMEEAAALAGPTFIINVIRRADGDIGDIVAGHPVLAHRDGVRRARNYFEVSVQRKFNTVLISDGLPVTMNLYQACKLLPPAGAILEERGTIILAAECTDGLGPISTINEAIYKLGCVHSLPRKHRVILVSRHSAQQVEPTFADYAPDISAALQMADTSSLAVIPHGGDLVPRLDLMEVA